MTEVERRWNLEPQGRVIAKAKKTGKSRAGRSPESAEHAAD